MRFTDEHATHYLIVGLGLVSVPDGQQTDARAVRTHTLGASLSADTEAAFTLGYARKTRLAIPADTKSLCVEIADAAGGEMRVQTCDAFYHEGAITPATHHP